MEQIRSLFFPIIILLDSYKDRSATKDRRILVHICVIHCALERLEVVNTNVTDERHALLYLVHRYDGIDGIALVIGAKDKALASKRLGIAFPHKEMLWVFQQSF